MPTFQGPNHGAQGGSVWTIGSGGTLDIASGGKLTVASTDVTGQLTNAVGTPVAGIASGYLLAIGTAAFSASGTATVVTGLATVTSFVAMLQGAGTSNIVGKAAWIQASILSAGAGGSVNVYSYGTNGTAIATSEVFNFFARGT